MAKMRQILIIGNNDNGCTPEIEEIAKKKGMLNSSQGLEKLLSEL